MALKNITITGNATAQSVYNSSSNTEAAIHTIVVNNNTVNSIVFEIFLNSISCIGAIEILANTTYTFPKPINISINTAVTIMLPADIKALFCIYEQAIDTAAALTAVQTSASAAATSADDAEASLNSFLGKFVGVAASAPTVDGAGNALTVGAVYFNTAQNAWHTYDGTTWLVSTYVPGTIAATTGLQSALDAKMALSGGVMSGAITSLREAKVAMGENDIDLATGNFFTKTISTATTFTISNVPTTNQAISFILELTNAGSATITWFAGVKWAGGSAPTLTSAGVDILGFYTHDGGTTWRGLVLAKDSK